MRFDIDTHPKARIIKVYDYCPIEDREILIYNMQFESGSEFIDKVNYMFSKNTNDLRSEIGALNRGIKKQLKDYLRERQVAQDDLYDRTGYHFQDVKLYTDLVEIKRLLGD